MYTGPLAEAPHHSFMGLCFAPSEERGSRGTREIGNKGNRDVVVDVAPVPEPNLVAQHWLGSQSVF